MSLFALEICAGGGGQALGLEQAGFEHAALAEIDPDACATLRLNRPHWKVIEDDIRNLDGHAFEGIDLVAGGVPCQPFSVGGQQLGHADERDLFPEALRIIAEARPKAVMLENVSGLGQRKFSGYRWQVVDRLNALGYTHSWWQGVNARDYGVPQLRPRLVLTRGHARRAGSPRRSWVAARSTAAPTWARPGPARSGGSWASTAARSPRRPPARTCPCP